jgi:hypothetical protein
MAPNNARKASEVPETRGIKTAAGERWLGLLGQVFGFLKWTPCGLRLSTVPLAEGPSRP